MALTWRGVIPAVTTPFNADGSIDHGFYAHHIQWMQSAGCVGVVPSGSLGEGATLTMDEK
ncbi:MAG: dihydrodipicolinate synthase family protein, partial [Roseiflexaceae bacterium]